MTVKAQGKHRQVSVVLSGCGDRCPFYVDKAIYDYPLCTNGRDVREINPHTEFDDYRYPVWCPLKEG